MSRIATDRASTIVAAVLVCVGYYVGARVGFAFTIHPAPVSILWPPNSILLAALLLMPPRTWALLLLAAFPAHFAIQFANDIPLTMILLWFVSNCSQALIGAACVRRLTGGPMRFDDSRHVGVFVLGSIIGVLLSGFLDAGFVEFVGGWGEGPFWQLWRARFFSNVLADLTVVPAIVAWSQVDKSRLRRLFSAPSVAEAIGLGAGLIGVSVLVFVWRDSGMGGIPALLYAPVPFLVWAAVRFGSIGTSTATMVVALLATRGAMNAVGPFVGSSPGDSALSIQLCLIFTSIPLLLLSAVMRERRRAEHAAVFNEESLKLALDAAQMTIWDWSLPPGDGAGRHESSETSAPWDIEFRVVHPDGNVRWVMGKGEVLRDEGGQPARLLGVNVDITDRRRADEAARASEELFARAFRSSPDAMVISRRADGQIIDVNDRWEALFGYSRASAVGRTMAELSLAASPEDQATLRRLIEAPGPVRNIEAQFLTRAGELRETIIATESVEMGGHACFITTIRDITERQRAQREAQEQRQLLTHLGRVAVLGELSGALAHELSQPLT